MIIPYRLKKGDTIGVVSPSGVVTEKKQLDSGIRFFEKLGFNVIVGKNALNVDMFSAGTGKERADDINTMFSDKNVNAIICSQGGATANECLPFLEWKIIKKNPKIFLGISDITLLLNTIYSKTGLVTFHGNDVMWGFGRSPSKYDKKEFVDRLMNRATGKINHNSEWRTIRTGHARGRLMGGNLTCLLKLAGTEYFPDLNGSLLFLEEYEPRPEGCAYQFEQLKQMGIFDEIAGVVIGYIYGMDNKKGSFIKMEDILLRASKSWDFPILKAPDFGHNCPNTMLPIGVKAQIDAGKKEIEILENCVK